MPKDAHALAVRVNWLKQAICPKCHNANIPGAHDYIELLPNGLANCGVCGHEWKPEDL